MSSKNQPKRALADRSEAVEDPGLVVSYKHQTCGRCFVEAIDFMSRGTAKILESSVVDQHTAALAEAWLLTDMLSSR